MRIVAFVVAGMLALFGSAALHYFHHDTGRAAARGLMLGYSNAVLKGRMQVGEITRVDHDRLVIRGYRLYAPNGDLVVRAPEIELDPDWSAFFEGELRYERGIYRNAEIWIREGRGGMPPIATASELRDDATAFPIVMRNLRLVDNVIHIDLPGKPSIDIRNVQGRAHQRLDHTYTWELVDTRGLVDAPGPNYAARGIHGRLKSDTPVPILLDMEVDLPLVDPRLRITYTIPPRSDEPHLSMDFGDPEAEEDRAERRADRDEQIEEAREDRDEEIEEAREDRDEQIEEAREEQAK